MKKDLFRQLLGVLFIFMPAFRLFGQAPPVMKVNSLPDFPAKFAMTCDKPLEVCVGDIVTFTFKGTPNPDHHLYSVKPKTDKGDEVMNKLTGFTFIKGESKDIVPVGPMTEYPKAHDVYDDVIETWERKFNDGQVVTYAQQFKITGPNPKLTGTFDFQVCKAEKCQYGNWETTWAPKVKTTGCKEIGGGANQNGGQADPPPTGLDTPAVDTSKHAPVENPPPANNDTVDLTGKTLIKDLGLGCSICESTGASMSQSCDFNALLALFLQAFAFGLFAIFTPCVFPIIPLNVSFFTKQSKTRSQGIRNGLIYAGFIVFIYVILGLGLTLIFGANFLYNFSTHWITNTVFFLLLFVFALSFFGWFEITLPSSWSTKLDAKSERGGLLGIFFMALTLVVVSFSCTGPIVGSVLISAAGQGSSCMLMPVVGMMGFSMALSIPFALLSVFPAFMNSMPKSGGWLNSVKVVLGFIELAMAMKFLSAADLVMEWHILDRDIFLGIWMVLFILLGVYLLGKIQLPHDSPMPVVTVPRLMMAIISIGFAAILLPGMFGKPIPILEGVIPPITKDIGVNVRGGVARPVCDEFTLNGKICAIEDRKYLEYFRDNETDHAWFYDICEALKFARKVKKPLFIDFTGHTCANCRKMEQTVFPNSKIEPYFQDKYVLVSLWVDDTNPLDKTVVLSDSTKLRTIGQLWLNLENKMVKQSAQPYYVLMDYNTEILVAPQGFTPTADYFRDFLQKGIDEFNKRHPDNKIK